MADQNQRDRAIERVLRMGAAASGADAGARPDAMCVDGETLAAWSSGALAQVEALRVEEHLADCARCQAMLAAFARTEPIAVSRAPNWRGARFRWLVPLATAATVAGILATLPQRNKPPEPLAESRAPLEAERPAAPVESVPVQPAPILRDQTAAPKREADAAQERKEGFAARRDNAAATAPGATDRLANSQRGREAARGEPPAAAAPAAPPPPRALEESVSVAAETRQLLAKAAAAEFASPDGTTRWRIVDGQVQRSTTQGKRWEPVTLPSGASITAGHSPTTSVAWFVGRAGVIFVIRDATTFERVPFVSSVDLSSVVAVDDRQATVTTVDGRLFRTTDRGISWISP